MKTVYPPQLFDENPAMNLQDIKETKVLRMDAWTHTRTYGQPENSIPTTNKVCGGIKICVIQVTLPRVLTRILKIGVKMLFARKNCSHTILFYWHF